MARIAATVSDPSARLSHQAESLLKLPRTAPLEYNAPGDRTIPDSFSIPRGPAIMKQLVSLLLLLLPFHAYGQDPKGPTTLRGVLLEQLRTTHKDKDWFVPANIAVEGLTADQAKWTDGSGNHSVGQLANHLIFWNREELAKFKGEQPEKFSGNNDETFNSFDSKQWNSTVKQLDEVLAEWERAVEGADEKKLEAWASTIAHIGAHNAYHVGQIVYVRKLQGSWDPNKGVK
jgi:uncharacterized damage-inducible protein DinB